MDVNFELYKIFYHVARTGSFSLAANHLFISQSAVSQNIKHLETKLGNELFFRKSRRIKLTPEGELLFRHIEEAFQLIKTAENKLDKMQNLEAGEIRIGAGDTVCKYFLLPYLKEFSHTYPHLKIKVTNRTSAQIREILQRGDIDLGIVTLPQTDSRLQIRVWKTVHDIFVASEKYRHLSHTPILLKHLTEYPMLLLEKTSTSRLNFELFMKRNQLTVNPELELESVDLLVEFARIGFGIAYVLEEAVREDIRQRRLYPITPVEKLPPREIGIISSHQVPLPKSAQRFVEMLLAKKRITL